MSELKLGKLIDAAAKRDAVHVAIAPVQSLEMLEPGQKVKLRTVDGKQWVCGMAVSEKSWDGVIDPFLEYTVYPGQWVWLWMKPGSITTLRHDFTHPALDGEK